MLRSLDERSMDVLQSESETIAPARLRALNDAISAHSSKSWPAKLFPVPHHFDDGVACRRFALHFAGNLARALVFVYPDRRHQFLLPDQGLDAQARLQRRD